MTDVFSKRRRSEVMAAVKSAGNKGTEICLARILRQFGITGWRRHQELPGKPDFSFPKKRLALFVDGCFWHACPRHGEKPKSNRAYWVSKLVRNKARDQRVTRMLREKQWRVLRIWEHDLRNGERVALRIRNALQARRKPPVIRREKLLKKAQSRRNRNHADS